jgi:hypothetical protein
MIPKVPESLLALVVMACAAPITDADMHPAQCN